MPVAKMRAELAQTCKAASAVLIEGVSTNLEKASLILLEPPQFFAAMVAEKPPAVFFWQGVFDVDEWLETELENAGRDESKVGEEDGYWPSLDQAREHLAPQLKAMQKHSAVCYFLSALYTSGGFAGIAVHRRVVRDRGRHPESATR